MAKITKCPPGKARGADDLQIWARRRNGGFSGVPDDRQQEKYLHKGTLQDMAHQCLFRLVAAGRKLDLENLRLAVHLLETLVHHLQTPKADVRFRG